MTSKRKPIPTHIPGDHIVNGWIDEWAKDRAEADTLRTELETAKSEARADAKERDVVFRERNDLRTELAATKERLSKLESERDIYARKWIREGNALEKRATNAEAALARVQIELPRRRARHTNSVDA